MGDEITPWRIVEKYVDESKLHQIYYDVEPQLKFSLLVHLLNQEEKTGSKIVMVFCNTRRAVDQVADNLKKDLFDQALVEIASLRDSVDAFFEGVMVMTDDMAVRRNRLALLGLIAALFGGIADFSKLST